MCYHVLRQRREAQVTEEQVKAYEALIELASRADKAMHAEYGGRSAYVEAEEIRTARLVLASEQYELVDVAHAGIDATRHEVEGLA